MGEDQQKESEKDTVYDENGQLVEDIVVPEENPEEENVAEDLQQLEDDEDEEEDLQEENEDEGLQEENEDDRDDLIESNLEESESTTTERFGAPSDGGSSATTISATSTQDGIVVNADMIRSEDSSSF